MTVALIELTFGVVAGNAFDLQSQDWLTFIAAFASIVLTFLAGMEVDPAYMRRRLTASVGIGVVSFVGPFVVASAVAYLLLDWSGQGVADRGHGALDHFAGGCVRGARRAGADGHEHRQAAHERDVRDRPLHGGRALSHLHQAERLVPGLPRRLACADPCAPPDRALVLRALRRPRDRAGDQARVRLPAPAHGAWPTSHTGTPCFRRSSSAWS